MARDATHDVPSGGKQIVFFFMAATFVAVVVFLCGVLVGRGVPRGGVVSSSPVGDHFSRDLPPATLTTPSSEPSAGAAASHDLSYPQRLTGRGPAADLVTVSEEVPAAAPERALDALDDDSAGRRGHPEGATYAVQVVASRGEAAAQAVASELRSDGLPVYVVDPDPEDPVAFFRVRVGPFPSRGDAEQALARLVGDDWMPGAYVTR